MQVAAQAGDTCAATCYGSSTGLVGKCELLRYQAPEPPHYTDPWNSHFAGDC
jgi:hypothetical protein